MPEKLSRIYIQEPEIEWPVIKAVVQKMGNDFRKLREESFLNSEGLFINFNHFHI